MHFCCLVSCCAVRCFTACLQSVAKFCFKRTQVFASVHVSCSCVVRASSLSCAASSFLCVPRMISRDLFVRHSDWIALSYLYLCQYLYALPLSLPLPLCIALSSRSLSRYCVYCLLCLLYRFVGMLPQDQLQQFIVRAVTGYGERVQGDVNDALLKVRSCSNSHLKALIAIQYYTTLLYLVLSLITFYLPVFYHLPSFNLIFIFLLLHTVLLS